MMIKTLKITLVLTLFFPYMIFDIASMILQAISEMLEITINKIMGEEDYGEY